MKRIVMSLIAGSCASLTVGCSATGSSNTFILTAELPENFAYAARANYVPAKGETCTVPGGRNTQIGFNVEEWRTQYKPDSEVELRRTVSGCPLVLYSIDLNIYAKYGKDRGDFGSDVGKIAVRPTLPERLEETFNAIGESELFGRCQWLFRTSGSLRRIVKILNCKETDAQGKLTRGNPFAAYTLDQLPGKTVRLRIKQADAEEPYMGDTWIKFPNGWKRCMGKSFEDQHAFCYGNDQDFSTFRMPDGRDDCTIYPGCTENQKLTP
ncbi:hypothetical protein [Pseudomonas sp. Ant30-3]|uniref:hypothetical protein n=1 Tax=Pseudomonas sp. Ant30-3 TaxID=1488328 RepID=UPI00048EF3C9|nr:hypothetical protein [Pseudomonas sp. Ant30-3]